MCCGVTACFWLGCQGLASSSQPANPPNFSKAKLIVFVHGYTGDQNTWSKFEKLVREDDALRDFEVHTMDYPTTSVGWKNRSIRQIGDLLWTQLIERFSAYREVYLIGHSMGGLVICSMVIEQLKAGRAQDLKPIRQIILFGTPNNGKQIPKLFRFFDKQLADISSAEQTVEELRNEWINRVYNPKISAGDENYKLHIPVTVVIGLEDDIVDEGSARSFFRDPPPLTVPGDHNSMKEPDSRESLAYVIVRNRLLSSVGPNETGDPAFPQLGLYFNRQPLEGQRIPIKMEKERESPPVYHISIRDIEVREEGRKIGAHVSTPRWHLSEKDIECLGGCTGEREPSNAVQYPTVFRGPAFSVDAGGKSYFQHILFRKHGHPATEIRIELELRYGPPDPVHATFTILPYE